MKDIAMNQLEDYLNNSMKKNNRDFPNPEFKPVEYSPEDSKIVFIKDGRSWEEDYQWLANYGNSNW